ncbi:hypothetical protein B0E45_08095 [Sinorhizobium sp. A49]|nr:hypothetical protein B0E45_08095 [Sinorhizobium sp. A49]
MNVWVELVGVDGVAKRREIAIVERIVDGARLDDLGLSLRDGKVIQRRLQEELTQFQADQAGQQDRKCHDCNRLRGVHDYRFRTVHSLFGLCRVRVPRLRSCACGKNRARHIQLHFNLPFRRRGVAGRSDAASSSN